MSCVELYSSSSIRLSLQHTRPGGRNASSSPAVLALTQEPAPVLASATAHLQPTAPWLDYFRPSCWQHSQHPFWQTERTRRLRTVTPCCRGQRHALDSAARAGPPVCARLALILLHQQDAGSHKVGCHTDAHKHVHHDKHSLSHIVGMEVTIALQQSATAAATKHRHMGVWGQRSSCVSPVRKHCS